MGLSLSASRPGARPALGDQAHTGRPYGDEPARRALLICRKSRERPFLLLTAEGSPDVDSRAAIATLNERMQSHVVICRSIFLAVRLSNIGARLECIRLSAP